MTDFMKKKTLNEVRLRNMTRKWSTKSMSKPKVQNLWNDLNESYSLKIVLKYSERAVVRCPGINFCFDFRRIFY